MNKSNYIRKLFVLERKDYIQIGEAVILLLISNFLIYLVPFRWWNHWIGTKNDKAPDEPLSEENVAKVHRIRRNVKRANKLLINWSKCFAISLTIKKMCERSSLPGILYLGVKKSEAKNLVAHAWVKCNNKVVYGGKEAGANFKEVVTFA